MIPQKDSLDRERDSVWERRREEQERWGATLLHHIEDPIKIISRIVRKTWKTKN